MSIPQEVKKFLQKECGAKRRGWLGSSRGGRDNSRNGGNDDSDEDSDSGDLFLDESFVFVESINRLMVEGKDLKGIKEMLGTVLKDLDKDIEKVQKMAKIANRAVAFQSETKVNAKNKAGPSSSAQPSSSTPTPSVPTAGTSKSFQRVSSSATQSTASASPAKPLASEMAPINMEPIKTEVGAANYIVIDSLDWPSTIDKTEWATGGPSMDFKQELFPSATTESSGLVPFDPVKFIEGSKWEDTEGSEDGEGKVYEDLTSCNQQ